jgi:hypothetical protein
MQGVPRGLDVNIPMECSGRLVIFQSMYCGLMVDQQVCGIEHDLSGEVFLTNFVPMHKRLHS